MTPIDPVRQDGTDGRNRLFRKNAGRSGRFSYGDTNLGSVATGAKGDAVLDLSAALIAGMFHRSSRYRRLWTRGKEGHSPVGDAKTLPTTEEHSGTPVSDRVFADDLYAHQGKLGTFPLGFNRDDVLVVLRANF